jgi:hypothetical protein
MSYSFEIPEENLPHPGHDTHLCFLENVGYLETHLDDYKKLVNDSRYVCKKCGRTANTADNLCVPEPLS